MRSRAGPACGRGQRDMLHARPQLRGRRFPWQGAPLLQPAGATRQGDPALLGQPWKAEEAHLHPPSTSAQPSPRAAQLPWHLGEATRAAPPPTPTPIPHTHTPTRAHAHPVAQRAAALAPPLLATGHVEQHVRLHQGVAVEGGRGHVPDAVGVAQAPAVEVCRGELRGSRGLFFVGVGLELGMWRCRKMGCRALA